MKFVNNFISLIPILLVFVDAEPHGLPKDCEDIQDNGFSKSGVYQIYPDQDLNFVYVYCDLETDGGTWTVIQRRTEIRPQINFERSWNDYQKGFGRVQDTHWIGLETITKLTNNGRYYSLRAELEDWDGEKRYAEYSTFQVANASENYRLELKDYHGDAGDSLSFGNGMKFTTYDKDNDAYESGNCAQSYSGAWWYGRCHGANLNGLYLAGEYEVYAKGITWNLFRGQFYSLKKVELKIRPVKQSVEA